MHLQHSWMKMSSPVSYFSFNYRISNKMVPDIYMVCPFIISFIFFTETLTLPLKPPSPSLRDGVKPTNIILHLTIHANPTKTRDKTKFNF